MRKKKRTVSVNQLADADLHQDQLDDIDATDFVRVDGPRGEFQAQKKKDPKGSYRVKLDITFSKRDILAVGAILVAITTTLWQLPLH